VQKESLAVSSSSMLEEDLTNNDRIKSSGWRRALDVAMNAAITTFEKNEDNSNVDVLNKPTEKYSAVVIFGNCSGRRTSRCAAFVQMSLKSATNVSSSLRDRRFYVLLHYVYCPELQVYIFVSYISVL